MGVWEDFCGVLHTDEAVCKTAMHAERAVIASHLNISICVRAFKLLKVRRFIRECQLAAATRPDQFLLQSDRAFY